MSLDAGTAIAGLRVDGGASENNFLMSFQADILNCSVIRPAVTETTALGAAYLAGLTCGMWSDIAELEHNNPPERTFTPAIGDDERRALLSGWHGAVRASRL